jgi:hypothetical protein
MDNLDVSMAPGCFGISLLYREGSNECKTCPFAAQCEPMALTQLASLRAELGIKVATVKKAAPSASPTAAPALSNRLPDKVQELVERVEKAGIKVIDALSRGVNPFPPQFAFMRVACHLLLKAKERQQFVPRQIFAETFMATLHVSRGTADAYEMQAIRALKAIGAISESNGKMRLTA